jgi:hypothetical protein
MIPNKRVAGVLAPDANAHQDGPIEPFANGRKTPIIIIIL